eukprot:TRINITY_DN2775_c0_g1_i3.p1 TRINITY_DN2775_c0_g1~~TRINITY_DN2775_c0_g1_i3.p1  ORF type:complete len:236 (-),score=26.62 TRINITY_DN2775_c0_g1_i3:43-702(-)
MCIRDRVSTQSTWGIIFSIKSNDRMSTKIGEEHPTSVDRRSLSSTKRSPISVNSPTTVDPSETPIKESPESLQNKKSSLSLSQRRSPSPQKQSISSHAPPFLSRYPIQYIPTVALEPATIAQQPQYVQVVPTYSFAEVQPIQTQYVVPQTQYVVPQTQYVVPQPEYIVSDPQIVVPQTEYVVPQTKYVIPQTEYIVTPQVIPQTETLKKYVIYLSLIHI